MKQYDLVVVGAGIVGLAVAREWFARHPGASILVVEGESDVAAHQTSHNSGVIHSGVYYEPGSLKARLCVEGARLMYDYAAEHRIPVERCGKLIVALEEHELPRLDELERRGRANDVEGLRRVGAAEIKEIEPHAAGLAALHSPGTGIVDYAEVARAIRRELETKHVELRFDTWVRSVRNHGDICRVELPDGEVTARRAITCAGLWSDRLARSSGAPGDPRIVPFRGGYLQLRRTEEPLVRGMIYPVPDPTLPFLGVHITRHINGTVSLGPTAMMVAARDGYSATRLRGRDVWETAAWPGSWRLARRFWRTGVRELTMAASRKAFVREAARYAPGLTVDDLDGSVHAGVRAQALGRDGSLVDDFALSTDGPVTHVRNAPSPAATASFAIAGELVDRVMAAN
ncbi:L-2-hydroxyglutarate oxidase [Nocardioides sp. IC4_145]|uniref:L-2-hydroxyglutarate oxidase n=1 Tax=Nocardioides sp. IC4_145 TaxID=2714037 RepID=UPI0014084819|nr:L-2-hydroxyglutarate oxidase [Nocardioides sp. IC4_145]NHC21892.1 L-2-hydroxyglutarate oxidase [Nocardioides sp. IC4_145]